MTCKHCNATLPDDAKFCNICGKSTKSKKKYHTLKLKNFMKPNNMKWYWFYMAMVLISVVTCGLATIGFMVSIITFLCDETSKDYIFVSVYSLLLNLPVAILGYKLYDSLHYFKYDALTWNMRYIICRIARVLLDMVFSALIVSDLSTIYQNIMSVFIAVIIFVPTHKYLYKRKFLFDDNSSLTPEKVQALYDLKIRKKTPQIQEKNTYITIPLNDEWYNKIYVGAPVIIQKINIDFVFVLLNETYDKIVQFRIPDETLHIKIYTAVQNNLISSARIYSKSDDKNSVTVELKII